MRREKTNYSNNLNNRGVGITMRNIYINKLNKYIYIN